ncbi:hypothetical protein JCM7686_2157 [Paracoccus aminophilus JCM 7686]|uniref:Uncharacterized protein n=1 Tax=Paracoccus aminophilus JCM 7686 TaxID=1367847 RepID=S5YCR1_PARAH|nr:hypothetical protein JCM7686_2157 [Paracoccus aminophilus JCM 7686]
MAGAWTAAGRTALGVPPDVVARAYREREGEASVVLLDWLSLMLPRWRARPSEGAVLFGLSVFVLVALAVLGFGYRLEMAQALVLLLLPLGLVVLARFRLAARLRLLLSAAHAGEISAASAATDAARQLRIHRFVVNGLSIVVIAVAAWWGALWLLAHPYGF